jgi:hypothetical protein
VSIELILSKSFVDKPSTLKIKLVFPEEAFNKNGLPSK